MFSTLLLKRLGNSRTKVLLFGGGEWTPETEWYWNGTRVEGGFKDMDKETSLGEFAQTKLMAAITATGDVPALSPVGGTETRSSTGGESRAIGGKRDASM